MPARKMETGCVYQQSETHCFVSMNANDSNFVKSPLNQYAEFMTILQ